MFVQSGAHRPAGLAPFFHEIEGIADDWFQPYNPSPVEIRYQRMMHKNIEEAMAYRQQYEHQWEWAARRFNLLASPLPDDRMSNILIPIVRVIINSRLASMTKGEMDVTYIPNYDEADKVELWRDCRRFVNNKCNYRYEMQNAFLMMSLFGPAPIYDGFRAAYQTHRIPTGNGDFKEVIARDPRKTMIFTQSIMPWNYLVSGGGRDHHDAPHYTYTVYMDYDQWVSEFARTPGYNGQPLYMHVRSVRPGVAYGYEQRDGGWYSRDNVTATRKICVNYHFIPGMDLMMIESNGVLNWVGPNPYAHKRSPFSMLRLHPQLDPKHSTMSVYGMGDAYLLSGLDTLYQNVMNMFVDNFYFSQSSVIGVPQGVSLDLDDEDFYGGTIIRGGEGMVVSQLGRLDGNSYNFMWKMLNDIIVWATGVPFNQLVPEGRITLGELDRRMQLANEQQAEVLRRNESYGLKSHAENQISNIFQFLPEEEFYSITDPDVVDSMVKEKKIGENDVVYEDGVAVMIRSYPMIETKGRVIEEKFVNGLPVLSGAKVLETGRDGRLAARPETIRPMEWNRDKSIPDVQIDSLTVFGPKIEQDTRDTMDAAVFGLNQNERAMKLGRKEMPFNEEEIYDDVLRVIRKNPRRWLDKYKHPGTKPGEGQDTRTLQKQMEAEMAAHAAATAAGTPPAGAPPAGAAMPPPTGNPQDAAAMMAAAGQQPEIPTTPPIRGGYAPTAETQ
jgi:hypothetical protein